MPQIGYNRCEVMRLRTRRIPSAWPIYITAAFWLLYGLACPIYQLKHLITATCVSIVVYVLASKFIPGRVVEIPVSTGDEALDAQIAQGRALLNSLREKRGQIANVAARAQLDRMIRAGEAIFDALVQQPARANQLRKFLNYYLPTAEDLLESYVQILQVAAPGENVKKACGSVENALPLMADAFEKQLDSLYGADALDITADVEVLKTMIEREGLTKERVFNLIDEDARGNDPQP